LSLNPIVYHCLPQVLYLSISLSIYLSFNLPCSLSFSLSLSLTLSLIPFICLSSSMSHFVVIPSIFSSLYYSSICITNSLSSVSLSLTQFVCVCLCLCSPQPHLQKRRGVKRSENVVGRRSIQNRHRRLLQSEKNGETTEKREKALTKGRGRRREEKRDREMEDEREGGRKKR
jgi:hypothetical protein